MIEPKPHETPFKFVTCIDDWGLNYNWKPIAPNFYNNNVGWYEFHSQGFPAYNWMDINGKTFRRICLHPLNPRSEGTMSLARNNHIFYNDTVMSVCYDDITDKPFSNDFWTVLNVQERILQRPLTQQEKFSLWEAIETKFADEVIGQTIGALLQRKQHA